MSPCTLTEEDDRGVVVVLKGWLPMSAFITLVSGLPRSGTSMMMRMLSSGGMHLAVDNMRTADEDNPQGYFELERVKQIKHDQSWLDSVQGKAVKMVSMLLYDLPADREYRIVFMRRDLDEIIASQCVMLERKGEVMHIDGAEMRGLFARHLGEVMSWIGARQGVRLLEVLYRDVLEQPEREADRINEFLGGGLEVDAMVRSVDKSLYRQRAPDRSAPDGDVQGTPAASDAEDQDKIERQLRSLGYM